jgi:large subunit ribosomal protein L29
MKELDFLSSARRLTVEELTGKIQESKKRLIEMDQEKLLGKLKNTASRRILRRQVAQLMTLRDEKVGAEIKGENA